MSAIEDKPRKASLLALYRLEFYRKKKNWQFKSRHKKPERERVDKAQSDANVTYTVDSCEDLQDSDVLNVAFIDAENQSINDQVKESGAAEGQLWQQGHLSQQWQHPINIWPSPPTTEYPVTERLHNLRRAYIQYGLEEADNEQNILKEARPCVDYYAGSDLQQEGCCCPQQQPWEWGQQPLGWGQQPLGWGQQPCEEANECLNVQQGQWLSEGQVEELWSDQVDAELDALDGAGRMDLGPRYDIPPTCDLGPRFIPPTCDLGQLDEEQARRDVSTDSEGEFMRGAHVAPHSSEMELSLEEQSAQVVSARALRRMSSRQLLRAQQHCAGVLTALMLEDAHRQRLRNARSDLSSQEMLPNHDRVLAGSHLSPAPPPAPGATGDAWPHCGLGAATPGRGRGRLL